MTTYLSRLDWDRPLQVLAQLQTNIAESREAASQAAPRDPEESMSHCRACSNRATGVSKGRVLLDVAEVRACEPSMSVTGEDVGRGSSREGPRPLSLEGK